MVIRVFVILLLLQSMIFSAQRGSKDNLLPQKSTDCSPSEEKWWNDLREKAQQISRLSDEFNSADRAYRNRDRRKGDLTRLDSLAGEMKKDRDDLLALIKVGQDNNYRAPVADGKLIVLTHSVPNYTEEARKHRISGVIVVEVECQPDGRIGKTK